MTQDREEPTVAKRKMTVDITSEDGLEGALLDVEAETADEARALALEAWKGKPAVAGRVWAEVD